MSVYAGHGEGEGVGRGCTPSQCETVTDAKPIVVILSN